MVPCPIVIIGMHIKEERMNKDVRNFLFVFRLHKSKIAYIIKSNRNSPPQKFSINPLIACGRIIAFSLRIYPRIASGIRIKIKVKYTL